MEKQSYKIAMVGLGPKGLYGLERILAQLKANVVDQKVDIHLFNKTCYMGSGDVYRSDQPDYLLMNFANKHINMWPLDAPAPVVDFPLSLSEFLAQDMQRDTDEIDPKFSSRSVVGAYLENGFKQLCENLPNNVILHQHIGEVHLIEKSGSGYTISFKKQGKKYSLNDFKNILISTGHQRHKTSDKANNKEVSFIYPVEEKLKNITKDHTIAIKGMGLTFIDAVLALTEGRGGYFTETKDGKLIYKASGKEPKCIYPFSKSGWPMLPKYDLEDGQTEMYINAVSSLNLKKLNFKNDLLPLITQDMEFAYYACLFDYEQEILQYSPDYEKIKSQIELFHEKYIKYKRFSIGSILEPEFNSKKSSHENVLEYLKAFTFEKNQNIANEAHLRAAAVWRKISPLFNQIYSFSGLKPDSHQEFDQYYFGKFNRIAYGPPPHNLKKIIALAETGIINYQLAKSIEILAHKNGYTLTNKTSNLFCDILIDARIPKNAISKESSGLFRNLCENGLARPYFNKDKNSSYAPGTIEIDPNGRVMNKQGDLENITLYGTPTEGIVHDNDTLSRTRNNFATPWADAIIQQLIKSKNDNKQKSTSTYAYSK